MRFPEWVIPMAATLTQERFTGPEWIFERKYDGIRLLAFRKGSTVRLLSRNQLPQSYPAVAGAIGCLAVDQIIHGVSRTTSRAVLSSRTPRKRPCRSFPWTVH